MVHLLVLRSRNTQGCFCMRQSLSSLSYTRYFSLNSFTERSRWWAILFLSFLLRVGVIFLQQLAQERQSTSCHTSCSAVLAIFFTPLCSASSRSSMNFRNFFLFSSNFRFSCFSCINGSQKVCFSIFSMMFGNTCLICNINSKIYNYTCGNPTKKDLRHGCNWRNR